MDKRESFKSQIQETLAQIYKGLAPETKREVDESLGLSERERKTGYLEAHRISERREAEGPKQGDQGRIRQSITQETNMKWDTAIERFKIGRMYHDVSISKVETLYPQFAEIGKEWLKSKSKKSLYISGNTGSGKTYFSLALFKGLIDQGIHDWLIYKRSDELDDELLRAIDERQEAFVLEKYHEVPFLFIDDLGVERVNDRIVKQYYSIVDRRFSNYLPTILTSNIPMSKIKNNLGERIASRLEHATEIEFPNRDLRKEI